MRKAQHQLFNKGFNCGMYGSAKSIGVKLLALIKSH